MTVTVVGNGTVNNTPGNPYTYAQTATLEPDADPGWTFAGWSGPDAAELSDNGDGTWDLTMDGDKSVTATFTQDEYTLTVNTVGDGAVDEDPDQATYHYGDVVTLTATADPDWSFSAWSGDLTGSTNPDTVTILGDTTVTATFTMDEYSLTVTTVGSGSVVKDPEQATYYYGDVVTLTASANDGWYFDYWTGAATGSTNPVTVTMNGDKSVTAYFDQYEYTLTVNTVGDGAVDKDPDQATYHYGDTVTLTATADAGWTFTGWSGDLTGSDNPDTITMYGNKTVIANFIQAVPPEPDHFDIDLPPSAKINEPFEITITALDQNDHLINDFNDAVSLSTDVGIGDIIPDSVTLNSGTWTGNVTIRSSGERTIIVTFNSVNKGQENITITSYQIFLPIVMRNG